MRIFGDYKHRSPSHQRHASLRCNFQLSWCVAIQCDGATMRDTVAPSTSETCTIDQPSGLAENVMLAVGMRRKKRMHSRTHLWTTNSSSAATLQMPLTSRRYMVEDTRCRVIDSCFCHNGCVTISITLPDCMGHLLEHFCDPGMSPTCDNYCILENV